MSILAFTIIALACWRLTSLLVKEDGPWDMFARLRHLLGVRYDAESRPYAERMLGKMALCPWCASVWIGGLMTVCMIGAPIPTTYLSLPLAFSAVAILIERMVGDGPS